MGTLILRRLREVGPATARRVGDWPGMLVVVVVYVVVAAATYSARWAELFGLLAAAAAGIGWYCSPLRRWESGRRARREGRGRNR